MSKSYNNTIPIIGAEKAVRKAVMGIVTDSTPVEDPKPVEGSTVLELYRLVATESEVAAMEDRFRAGGVGYGDMKKDLFGAVWEYFEEVREKRVALEADPGHIEEVLRAGAERARNEAARVLARVREAVGLS